MDIFEVLPTITGIDPSSAEVGDEIKVIGTGFSVTALENMVSFDGGVTYVVASEYIKDTESDEGLERDTIAVSVPSVAMTGELWIKILAGTPSESSVTFTLLPSINELSPDSGLEDAPVSIIGTGFSSTSSENTVTFLGDIDDETDNMPATVLGSSTDMKLDVTVPTGAVTGRVEVIVDGVKDTSEVIFTVLDPAVLAIISVSPEYGAVGETIMIMGQNFGEAASDNTVTFLGDESDTDDDRVVEVLPTNSTTMRLEVVVPTRAVTGPIDGRSSRWRYDRDHIKSLDPFEVLPTIGGIHPSSASSRRGAN